MMPKTEKKKRLHVEMPKVRRTSHWDLDYLPLKEVDRLYAQDLTKVGSKKNRHRRIAELSKGVLGLILVCTGLLLIGMAAIIGRFLSN